MGQKTFDAFMDLSFFLEEIFQRKVEIVTLESLTPYIGPHILKEVEYAALAAGTWMNLRKNYELRLASQEIGDALEKNPSASRKAKPCNDLHP